MKDLGFEKIYVRKEKEEGIEKTRRKNQYIYEMIKDYEVIGKLTINFDEEYEGKEERYYRGRAIVSNIYVKSTHRRQGVGERLYMEAAKDFNKLGKRLYSSDCLLMDGRIFWERLMEKYPDKVKKSEEVYVREEMLELYPEDDYQTYYIDNVE
jgi:GNAT superfamily N-acetyltransferase